MIFVSQKNFSKNFENVDGKGSTSLINFRQKFDEKLDQYRLKSRIRKIFKRKFLLCMIFSKQVWKN